MTSEIVLGLVMLIVMLGAIFIGRSATVDRKGEHKE